MTPAGYGLFIECWLQVVMLSVEQLVCNWSSKITHGFENSKFFLVIFLLRGLWVHGFMSLRVEGLKGLRVV
jgi:1-acyl-sn-glycerol-3-phosphate acyltransferase